MTQKDRVLSTLRAKMGHPVKCRDFEFDLYHKLASRCSDLRKQGYNIVYTPSPSDSPMDASYTLLSEPVPVSVQGEQYSWNWQDGNYRI